MRDGGSENAVPWMKRRKRRSFCLTQLSSLKAVPFICLRKVSMEKENDFFENSSKIKISTAFLEGKIKS